MEVLHIQAIALLDMSPGPGMIWWTNPKAVWKCLLSVGICGIIWTQDQSCMQGYANYLATQRPHTVDNSTFLDSKKGIMSFFNTGSSLFASDNGLAEAQKFYSKNRRGNRR